MQTSEHINDLAAALAIAQGEITGALKDSANPFFKSKYADLAACWDACRAPLSKNGLAVIQTMFTDEGGMFLITRLAHSSGQWINSETPIKPKDDTPQAMGSALTYARRYALTAMVGIAQVDDDGNAGSGRKEERVEHKDQHDPRGELGKNVPVDKARATAMRMLEIMAEDRNGDHEDHKKAMDVLDYHDKVLNPDEDLYVAVGAELPAAKKNAWKALVSLGKKLEAADRTVGRKF